MGGLTAHEAMQHLHSKGVPQPSLARVYEDQISVMGTWPWGGTIIRHSVRVRLASPPAVSAPDLDEAAVALNEWFEDRKKWKDSPYAQEQTETQAAPQA